jgi:hypothetical protein
MQDQWDRYVNAQISVHGRGLKYFAFFLAQCLTIITKSMHSPSVSQVHIDGPKLMALEQRGLKEESWKAAIVDRPQGSMERDGHNWLLPERLRKEDIGHSMRQAEVRRHTRAHAGRNRSCVQG